MGDFMETIKDIAAVVGCISAIIALITTIFKPVRKKIVNWVKHTSEASETSVAIKSINDRLNALEKKIDEFVTASKTTENTIIERINVLDDRVEKLDRRVLENERDRIKSELSEYASRCARGMKIYPEEMIHIEEMYTKYSNEMHCNHTGTENYNIIVNYYKNQDWLKA